MRGSARDFGATQGLYPQGPGRGAAARPGAGAAERSDAAARAWRRGGRRAPAAAGRDSVVAESTAALPMARCGRLLALLALLRALRRSRPAPGAPVDAAGAAGAPRAATVAPGAPAGAPAEATSEAPAERRKPVNCLLQTVRQLDFASVFPGFARTGGRKGRRRGPGRCHIFARPAVKKLSVSSSASMLTLTVD